jgi:hypothetical protein
MATTQFNKLPGEDMKSGQFEYTGYSKASSKPQPTANSDDPFTRWGTINTSLQQILNTQKFGDIYSVTTKEETVFKEYIFRRYPVLKEHQVQFKIGKVPDTERQSVHMPTQLQVPAAQFNVVFFGPRCPLSKCCKLSLCLCICGLTGTAKVNCMATAGAGGGAILSHYNP